ncbi:MAG: S8 family serine peptidase [Nanoarchaeota archaeon]|nr:S8 family serine peptidase [Nanoarchaeota archaeon]MBU1445377.1 S8 family serine peptidase [Nanoarchaeota archaeon]MBU2406743.1 S8 family serine peptidase [Nanoarchaeota archaeon]MBU2420150.1 S8 family serine peptidase [Nanoarchaeota archaeon]MBU2475275.1 S8 family serine peptidase [Nanoarchaeota archaeon]
MKFKFLIGLILIILLVFPTVLSKQETTNFVSDSLIVKLNSKMNLNEIKNLDPNIINVDYLFGDSKSLDNRAKNLEMDTFYIVKLKENSNITKIAEKLSKNSKVESVEFDYFDELTMTPNDQYFFSGGGFFGQWNLYNYGQQIFPGVFGISGVDVDARKAWDIETGNPDVLIAVLDTGVNYNHADLRNKISDIRYDFVDEDNDPMDQNGHGTSISGMAGAQTNNNIGIASLCPECTIVPVRVCTSSCLSSNVIQGIYFAVDNDVDVISMSFGGYDSDCSRTNGYDIAIQYAYENGVTLVAGAGNDYSSSSFYPACRPEVISVAGHGASGQINQSNYGNWVDVAAPNVLILTTVLSGGYGLGGGTSIAAPQVSALIGLLISSHGDITPDKAKEFVMLTSEELDWDETPINSGRINAYNALSACFIDNEIILNQVCVDDGPKMCFEQELISNCQECSCPTGKYCMSNGECSKYKVAVPFYL